MKRARRLFWLLVIVAVVAAGGVSQAVKAEPGPITALALAASASLLAVSLALAARVMLAIERARRRT